MTLRFKLTIGFIAVILVANSLLSLVTILHVNEVLIKEVRTRVRIDLNSARQIYNSHIDSTAQFLRAVSLEESVCDLLKTRDVKETSKLLQTVYHVGGMDILALVSPEGRVIFRPGNPKESGDDLSGNPVIARALAERKTIVGTIVVPSEQLIREGGKLADQAHIQVISTPAEHPTSAKVKDDGMMVAAAVPVLSAEGELMGLLYGADLLNRRQSIVDAIRDQIFPDQKYEGKEVGTATIFLGDLRIATNVPTRQNKPAIGTRMSAQVYDQVLVRGQLFADRAFVVDDWYITAYEPIRDPKGKVIGAIYVGLREAPYTRTLRGIITVFLTMMAITTAVSLLLLFLLTRHVLWPIDRILAMSRQIIAGDLSARSGIRPHGEMGKVCEAIDRMADALAEREEQFKRVASKQIGQSEKLASIGRLAAGVAHEINNPLTGVLTFSSLLRQKSNMDDQDKQDLDLIVRETTRVREIVRGLLDFARESPSIKQSLDINEVIANTMRLVRSQKEFRNITIQEQLGADLPPVFGDKNQLQQVILNLSLNACEAMHNGGTLTIRTQLNSSGQLEIAVSDTGCGIKSEHRENIFEPFFTTKPIGKGTGLGLSVSYGIVQQHGGAIDFQSEEGKGTTFIVVLPNANDDDPPNPMAPVTRG